MFRHFFHLLFFVNLISFPFAASSTETIISNGNYLYPVSYSADKNTALLLDRSNNLSGHQVFLRDIDNNTTLDVSINADSEFANETIQEAVITQDGEFVFFTTDATNLTDDSNVSGKKLFLYNVSTGVLSVVKDADGRVIGGTLDLELVLPSNEVLISLGAKFYVVPTTGVLGEPIETPLNLSRASNVSPNGKFISFTKESNCSIDLFIADLDAPLNSYPIDFNAAQTYCIRAFYGITSLISDDGQTVYISFRDSNNDNRFVFGIYDKLSDTFTESFLHPILANKYTALLALKNDGSKALVVANVLDRNNVLLEVDILDKTGDVRLLSILPDGNVVATDIASAKVSGATQYSNTRPKIAFTNTYRTSAYLTDTLRDLGEEPLNVRGLMASNNQIGKVQLSWFFEGEDSKFVIFRKSQLEDAYKYIGHTSELEFTDTSIGLEADVTYDYLVQVCNQYLQCSEGLNTTGVLVAPEKVINVNFERTSSSYVNFRWPEVEGASHYKVFSRSNYNEDVSTTSSTNRTLYLNYNYPAYVQITACVNDVCGEASDGLKISSPQNERVEGLRYFVNDNLSSVRLVWDENSSADYYNVYSVSTGIELFRRKVYDAEFIDTAGDFSAISEYRVESCKTYQGCSSKSSRSYTLPTPEHIESIPTPYAVWRSGAIAISITGGTLSKFETVKIYGRTERFGTPILKTEMQVGIGGTFEYFDFDIEYETELFYFAEYCINDTCALTRDVKINPVPLFLQNIALIENFTASKNEFSNAVKLQWSAEGQTDGFQIFRDGALLATINTDTDTYMDTSVYEGVRYQYEVRALINYSNITYYGPKGIKDFGSTEFFEGVPAEIGVEDFKASQSRFLSTIHISWLSPPKRSLVRLLVADRLDGPFTLLTEKNYYNDQQSATTYSHNYLDVGQTKFYKIETCINQTCFTSPVISGTTSNALSKPVFDSEISDIEILTSGEPQITFTTTTEASYYVIRRKPSIFASIDKVFNAEDSPYLAEAHTTDGIFYYAIQACNARGCSNQSEFVAVRSLLPDLSEELGTKGYSISDLESDESSIEIEARRKDYWGESPDILNIYMATELTGDKTLIKTVLNPNRTVYHTESDLEVNTQYYVWTEVCTIVSTTENYCELDPRVRSQVTSDSQFTIDTPDAPIAQSLIGAIRLKAPWIPSGASYRVTYRKLSESQERVSTLYSVDYTLNLYSNTYQDQDYVLRGYLCYDNTCSEGSPEVIETSISTYTSEIKYNEDAWSSQFSRVYERDNALGFSSNPRYSKQSLWIGEGFELSFDAYVTDPDYYYCNSALEIYAADGVPYNDLRELFKVYNGDRGCSDGRMINDSLVFIEVGDGNSELLSFSKNEVIDRWSKWEIRVDGNYNVTVIVNGKYIGRLKSDNLALLETRFAQIGLSSVRAVTDISAVSNEVFDIDSPLPTSFSTRTRSTNSRIEITPRDLAAGARAEVDVFQVNGTRLTKMTSLSSPDPSQFYYPSEPGRYLFAGKQCIGEKCSSVDYELESVDADWFLARTSQITLSQVDRSTSLDVTWASVDRAAFYKLYINRDSPYSTVFEDQTAALNFRFDDLPRENVRVGVQACDFQKCGDIATKSITVAFDRDGDGLLDRDEKKYGTDPLLSDTDGDGISDNDEIMIYNTSALKADTDGDGINDRDEIESGRDPLANDGCIGYLCSGHFSGWRLAESIK